MLAAATGS